MLELAAVRDAAAAALAPAGEEDPAVFADVVEAVVPPALMIGWEDPWLEPAAGGRPTLGPCTYQSRLRIVCVAARLDPGSGVDELERLVTFVLERLRDDPYPWVLENVSAPRQTDQAGISSLVAELTYTVPTSL